MKQTFWLYRFKKDFNVKAYNVNIAGQDTKYNVVNFKNFKKGQFIWVKKDLYESSYKNVWLFDFPNMLYFIRLDYAKTMLSYEGSPSISREKILSEFFCKRQEYKVIIQ